MTGLYVLLAALAVSVVLGVWYRRTDGKLKAPRRRTATTDTATDDREDLRPLLPTAGDRATLLQFSSAFCAPCRATRRVLEEVAATVPGVVHVEVDAESHLELVRHLRIMKTPTTLVLDEAGREVLRASGQPRKAAVLHALQQAVPS